MTIALKASKTTNGENISVCDLIERGKRRLFLAQLNSGSH